LPTEEKEAVQKILLLVRSIRGLAGAKDQSKTN